MTLFEHLIAEGFTTKTRIAAAGRILGMAADASREHTAHLQRIASGLLFSRGLDHARRFDVVALPAALRERVCVELIAVWDSPLPCIWDVPMACNSQPPDGVKREVNS